MSSRRELNNKLAPARNGGYDLHSPGDDPAGPETGSRRMFRGGYWLDGDRFCRSAPHYGVWHELRDSIVGFRISQVSADKRRGPIMSVPRRARREKDGLAGDLGGRSEPPPTLAEALAYWQEHNPHPQFRLFGIWRPDHYDWAQRVIARGPKAWQEHAGELSRHADWRQETVDPRALELIEQFLDAEAPQSDVALQQRLRNNRAFQASGPQFQDRSLVESALRQYIRDCGNFFAHVRQYGLAGAAAILAYDERWEKHTRRHEHLDDVLCLCIPQSDERLRLFQEVMAGPEPADSISLRARAMRFLPPLAADNAGLRAMLCRFLQDNDELVRFWAAYHLSAIDPATPGLGRELLIAFGTRVSDGYDDSNDTDARHAEEALSRLGQPAVMETIRSLMDRGPRVALLHCCEVLSRWPGPDTAAMLHHVADALQKRTS